MRNDPTDFRDAYLRWGLATDFRYFVPRRGPRVIGLIIEWKTLEDAGFGLRILRAADVWVPGVYAKGQRVWAVSVQVAQVRSLLDAIAAHVQRVELASPVQPAPRAESDGLRRRRSEGSVLLAMLDDGCAFANACVAPGGQTRVVWLWNQDGVKGGLPLDGSVGPWFTTDFAYGRQWSKEALDVLIQQAGVGEQAAIYRTVELPGLRRAVAHGTHVMDLLAGGRDEEIVFVQFPADGIDDPSGRWLARNAIDGLHYVLECAGPSTTKIVVNISWGPQTGPHDGTSVLETCIADLVAQQTLAGKELVVCLPTGNSFAAQAHGRLDQAEGGRLVWNVPPDGETPAFVEIWWPTSTALADARLCITPPGGTPVDVRALPLDQGSWQVDLQRPAGQGAMVLLTVNPTARGVAGVPAGRAGRWVLDFDAGSGPAGDIHVYVARADHNMGARRRAKSSWLSDPALAAARFRSAADRDAEAPGSSVQRAGSLNGMATGASTRVASGYAWGGDFANASYSSSGPTRDGRQVTDHACVTDRSRLLEGVAASGVRSGTKAILVGTSTAAPQMARQYASAALKEFEPYSGAPPCRDGESRLRPDPPLLDRP